MNTYKAEITVRGWTQGTQEDSDKNVSVPRCTKVIHHIFEASSEMDAEITLKWFLNHPETKYRFEYHSIKKVVLSQMLSDVPHGTAIDSLVKDTPLKHARGIGVVFDRNKLYIEEARKVNASSDLYVVVFWGKYAVQISKSASPGDQTAYNVPIDSLTISGEEGETADPKWSSLSETELLYLAFKQKPVFEDIGVETAVS